MTQAGGQGWVDISAGLDGSSVVGIYPDPDRGSHAAYAVTLTGVFYSPDIVGLATATVWTNITSNLTTLHYNAFGNPAYQQSVLAGFSYVPTNPLTPTTPPNWYNLTSAPVYNTVFSSQYGGFTDIVADYRYQIPQHRRHHRGDHLLPGPLRLGLRRRLPLDRQRGDLDRLPRHGLDPPRSTAATCPRGRDQPPARPGRHQPDTGHADPGHRRPRGPAGHDLRPGRLRHPPGPRRLPHDDPVRHDPAGPHRQRLVRRAGITNVLEPYLDGVSEISNFGNTVTIKLYDESPGPSASARSWAPARPTPSASSWSRSSTPARTRPSSRQHGPQRQDRRHPGDRQLGRQRQPDAVHATRSTTITPVYARRPGPRGDLRHRPVQQRRPDQPLGPGPGGARCPVDHRHADLRRHDARCGAGQPAHPEPDHADGRAAQERLSPNGPFFVIDETQTGIINGAGTGETYMLTDPTIAALAASGIDQTFYYEALQSTRPATSAPPPPTSWRSPSTPSPRRPPPPSR